MGGGHEEGGCGHGVGGYGDREEFEKLYGEGVEDMERWRRTLASWELDDMKQVGVVMGIDTRQVGVVTVMYLTDTSQVFSPNLASVVTSTGMCM